jgi:hypothetical protein
MKAIVLALSMFLCSQLYLSDACSDPSEFYNPCYVIESGLWFVPTGYHEGNCYSCPSSYMYDGTEYLFEAFNPSNTECYFCPSGTTSYNPSTNQCCISGTCTSSQSQFGTHIPGTPACDCATGDVWFSDTSCLDCLAWFFYNDEVYPGCPEY